MREAIARGLDHARARTLTLNEFDDAELVASAQPADEPAGLGPRAMWASRRISGCSVAATRSVMACCRPRSTGSTTHSVLPARDRAGMPLLSPVEARRFIADVRARAFDQLDRADDLFPFAMVEQHEQQHVETMFATHQLRDGEPLLGARQRAAAGARGAARCRAGPGRRVRLGRRRRVRAVVAGQRASGHTSSTCRPSASGGCRSPTPSGSASSTTADTTAPQWWSARGWAHRVEPG